MQPTRLLPLFEALTLAAFAQPPTQQPDGFIPSDFLGATEPKARLLIVGTFHFQERRPAAEADALVTVLRRLL